jgi:hypothetical protein
MRQLKEIAAEELECSIPSLLELLCGPGPSESNDEKGRLKGMIRGVLLKGLQELPWDSEKLVKESPGHVLLCLECLHILATRLAMPEEALRIAETKLPHIVERREVKDLSATALCYWLQLRIHVCTGIGYEFVTTEDDKLLGVKLMAEQAVRALKSDIKDPELREDLWVRLSVFACQYLGEEGLLRVQAEILTHAIPWVPQEVFPTIAPSLPIVLADALIWEGRLSEAEKVICRYKTKEATYRALADLRLAFIAFERGDDKRAAEVARSVYNVLCQNVSCDSWGYEIAVLLMHWGSKHPKKLNGLVESLSAERRQKSTGNISEPDEYGVSCGTFTLSQTEDKPSAAANYCIKNRYTHQDGAVQCGAYSCHPAEVRGVGTGAAQSRRDA